MTNPQQRLTHPSVARRVQQLRRLQEPEALREALASLSYRERHVLELRYGLNGEPVRSLDEIGRTFNITRERARQIEMRAFETVVARVEDVAKAREALRWLVADHERRLRELERRLVADHERRLAAPRRTEAFRSRSSSSTCARTTASGARASPPSTSSSCSPRRVEGDPELRRDVARQSHRGARGARAQARGGSPSSGLRVVGGMMHPAKRRGLEQVARMLARHAEREYGGKWTPVVLDEPDPAPSDAAAPGRGNAELDVVADDVDAVGERPVAAPDEDGLDGAA